MKILVTGGAGFIGSNLVKKLVTDGHEVTVLDDFSMGTQENLAPVKSRISVVKGDIRDEKVVSKAVKDVDVVFNQAAASSSPMFLKNLREAVSVNVDGFINILNACRDNGVKKLIYASTSSVYGNLKPPGKEDAITPPVNFYASTKLMNEHFGALFSRQYGLETIGLRYLSVYGPNENSKGIYANLVSQFLSTMQKGRQPVVYGDGRQSREFTYVKDVVAANLLFMNSKRSFGGEVFNVGTGKTMTLNDLVATINRILGKSIKPNYVHNDVRNYIGIQLSDISKIKKAVGYEPQYTVERGITEIIS